MWSVIRYHGLLRSGTSWKVSKHVVELWHDSLSESDSTSTLSFFIDENDNRTARSTFDNATLKVSQQKSLWDDFVKCDSDVDDLKEDEKFLGNGSDEDDSLLVIYQDNSHVYWQYKPSLNWEQTNFSSISFEQFCAPRTRQMEANHVQTSFDALWNVEKCWNQLRNKSFKSMLPWKRYFLKYFT